MKVAVVAFLLAVCAVAFGQSDDGEHNVFTTSFTDQSYYYSKGEAVAPSSLELVKGKSPVVQQGCLSPPDCLRLQWNSQSGGDWNLSLRTRKEWGNADISFAGSTLSFWLYSEAELPADASPRIRLGDTNGEETPAILITGKLDSLPAKKWTRIQLPFDSFKGLFESTNEARFKPARIASITIFQGLDDSQPHTLLIDDVQVRDESASASRPPAAPSRLTAKGYDRHVELSWDYATTSSLLYFKIYRSSDGDNFQPLAVSLPGVNRYEDFLGASNKEATYKISAVDVNYRESPPSNEAGASTRAMSDDELLTMVQEGCFRYYWGGAHPVAGMALEVIPGDRNLVALGASGFGIMALITAVERGFITREQGLERMQKITRFLEKADRFHGVWPHFLDGRTGKTIPLFGPFDNGGDLVETAFLTQGLLTARQYFNRDAADERELRDRITTLWRGIEWDWYRKEANSNFLYWHWSPDRGFHISHPLVGWNETMIVYLLAIASPTHAVPASMYHTGWAGQSDLAVQYRRYWGRTKQGDHYANGNRYYGIKLDVGVGSGGELFFTQFSFLGFDPRNKRDKYTNYFRNNRSIALIHHAYSIANPLKYVGYGDDTWGRSAGVNSAGGKPNPRDDNGTITIHGALGSMPYTPEESMKALRHFYRDLGGKTWGVYGFIDGFNQTDNWYEPVNMGLNQAQIVAMIQNYRTGQLWKLFMSNPEIAPALKAIGFQPD